MLGSGYPTAHVGATIACDRARRHRGSRSRRGRVHWVAAAVAASRSVRRRGGVHRACANADERRVLATYGDQSRDLVGLWRTRLRLRSRRQLRRCSAAATATIAMQRAIPARSTSPGDGIDQDCDGADAMPIVTETAASRAPRPSSTWRAKAPCGHRDARKTKGMNVLLITVDALRADMLAPDAPDRADFPTLTKLLDDSVWFTHAIAPATGTDVSLVDAAHRPLRSIPAGRYDAARGDAGAAAWRRSRRCPPRCCATPARRCSRAASTKSSRCHTDWDSADVGDHVSAAATDEGGAALARRCGDEAASRVRVAALLRRPRASPDQGARSPRCRARATGGCDGGFTAIARCLRGSTTRSAAS